MTTSLLQFARRVVAFSKGMLLTLDPTLKHIFNVLLQHADKYDNTISDACSHWTFWLRKAISRKEIVSRISGLFWTRVSWIFPDKHLLSRRVCWSLTTILCRVSTTTRPQRRKEDDGIDYFFTTQEEFEKDVMEVGTIGDIEILDTSMEILFLKTIVQN